MPFRQVIKVAPTETNMNVHARRIHIAGLIGALFKNAMVSANAIRWCLNWLIKGSFHHERLCAMHALILQINDKLYKLQDSFYLTQFREAVTQYIPRTPEYSSRDNLSVILMQACLVLACVIHIDTHASSAEYPVHD